MVRSSPHSHRTRGTFLGKRTVGKRRRERREKEERKREREREGEIERKKWRQRMEGKNVAAIVEQFSPILVHYYLKCEISAIYSPTESALGK